MSEISVIIPVYNTEDYLDRCLDSLENQTYKDFNVIAINDGSTDKSLEVLEKRQDNTNLNLTVLNQENLGVAKARQNGINKSDSRYLSFIDSDDYVEKYYLEKLISTIKQTDTNICFGRCAFHFNIDLIRKIGFKTKKFKLQKINVNENKEILPTLNVITTDKLFKREYINITDKNFKANEDLSINHLNFALANDISFTNDAIYHYLPNSDGLVATQLSNYSYEKMLNTFGPLKELKENFKRHNLDTYYREELEALFIKNLFERIDYIKHSIKDKDKKTKLISCIIEYLEFHYPNWRKNKYYQENFKSFELPDIYRCISVNRELKKLDISCKEKCTNEQKILEKYKNLI